MNKSFQKILALLEENKYTVRYPIMLTADQFDHDWSISIGWSGTGLKIAKKDLYEPELVAMMQDPNTAGKIIVNKVFEAKI